MYPNGQVLGDEELLVDERCNTEDSMATNGNEWWNSCGHDVSMTPTLLAYLMPVCGMHARPKLLMVTKKT